MAELTQRADELASDLPVPQLRKQSQRQDKVHRYPRGARRTALHLPRSSRTLSTSSNGRNLVKAPKWPGACSPFAVVMVRVSVIVPNWPGNGTSGVEIVLVDSSTTAGPVSLSQQPRIFLSHLTNGRRTYLHGIGRRCG